MASDRQKFHSTKISRSNVVNNTINPEVKAIQMSKVKLKKYLPYEIKQTRMDKEVKEFINQEQQKHTKLTRVEKT